MIFIYHRTCSIRTQKKHSLNASTVKGGLAQDGLGVWFLPKPPFFLVAANLAQCIVSHCTTVSSSCCPTPLCPLIILSLHCPLVVTSGRLVVASPLIAPPSCHPPLVVFSLCCPLVVLCRLVVASPLVTLPSHPYVAPPSHPLVILCHRPCCYGGKHSLLNVAIL
jgi:hypothetical protein